MTIFLIAHTIHDADQYRRAHLRNIPRRDVVLLPTRSPLGDIHVRGRHIDQYDEIRWLPGWSHGRHVARLVESLRLAGWTGTPPT